MYYSQLVQRYQPGQVLAQTVLLLEEQVAEVEVVQEHSFSSLYTFLSRLVSDKQARYCAQRKRIVFLRNVKDAKRSVAIDCELTFSNLIKINC